MPSKQEEIIRSSIEYATKELGFTLVYSDWGNNNLACACPMGCVVVKIDPNTLQNGNYQEEVLAAQTLGVSTDWIYSFIVGFDNSGHHQLQGQIVPEAKELGQKIFDEFNPTDYFEVMKQKLSS